MREKVRDLIYLDAKKHLSLESLRVFYWAILFLLGFFLFLCVAFGLFGRTE